MRNERCAALIDRLVLQCALSRHTEVVCVWSLVVVARWMNRGSNARKNLAQAGIAFV